MVQRSPSHFQTGTFYWSHVSFPYLILPFSREKIHRADGGSTRRCVSSTRRSPLWAASTSVSADGIRVNMSSLMKTLPSLTVLMGRYGTAKTMRTSGWQSTLRWTSRSRICLTGTKCRGCHGQLPPSSSFGYDKLIQQARCRAANRWTSRQRPMQAFRPAMEPSHPYQGEYDDPRPLPIEMGQAYRFRITRGDTPSCSLHPTLSIVSWTS